MKITSIHVKGMLLTSMLMLFFAPGQLSAQHMKHEDSMMKKMLTDTNLVTAYETILEPGQSTGVHTHPAHFFYALTDTKIKVSYTDGEIQEWDLKAGECGYGDPERPHSTMNTGKKQVRFLVVELKEHPYMSKMMK